jgi:carbonic anhydrase
MLAISCTQQTADDHTSNPLERLKTGNERFYSGEAIHPDEEPDHIQELSKGQHPFAVIVSCSDSRVPPELIFDQGFGDIFSIRTAGNIIGEYELGSVEYAVEHLHCKLVLVLGHQGCGAVESYLTSNGNYQHHDHIKSIIDYIGCEEEVEELAAHHADNIENTVEANVKHGVNLLKHSNPILQPLINQNELLVIGAVYDMNTGQVHFNN